MPAALAAVPGGGPHDTAVPPPPPPSRARASFVAVTGPADPVTAAAPRASPAALDARVREEALATARASAPIVFTAIVIPVATLLLVLGSSPWLWGWLLASAVVWCAWGATLLASRGRRGAHRWRQGFVALGAASLVALAFAPWLAQPLLAPPERLVLTFALATAGIAAATAFAPLPALVGLAALLPLSAAIADGLRSGAAAEHVGMGVLLALATALVALVRRQVWLRATRAAVHRDERIRELESARDAAMRSDQEKSRFVAIASHDLRQPMHALGLFAATLEKRLQGSGEAPLVHNLVHSIDGLDRAFNVMLDISRLDAGTIEPNFQHFPLRDLFRRLHMHFAGQAEQAGLGLRFSPGGKSVSSDPQLLERILGNLIQNAIKYTQRGGIVVVARTTRDYVNVEVWDTGPGIQAGELPRIFDEFYQVGRGERARERGLGMGLAIVKRLAQLLGHRLEVASQPGGGTMFRIGIPVGGLRELQDVTAAADTLPMPLPVAQPRTVLVIEDEAAIRGGLSLLLHEWGYQVLAAATVDQAERVVRRLDVPPDLILSDLHLGEGPDGLEAIEAVRRECGFDVPAILVTGDTSYAELRRATDSGHPVLFKPVQPRKLLNALRGHIP